MWRGFRASRPAHVLARRLSLAEAEGEDDRGACFVCGRPGAETTTGAGRIVCASGICFEREAVG